MSAQRYKDFFTAIIGVFAAVCVFFEYSGAIEYIIQGRIESLRKNNNITILFKTRPTETTYSILYDNTVCGTVDITAVEYAGEGAYRYRCVARYRLANKIYLKLIRAGADIGLGKLVEQKEQDLTSPLTKEEGDYRLTITAGDNRVMVLVPEGKFVFGANNGDRDESPEQIMYLENFYIDKYEVSNREYKIYVEAANVRPPQSWEGGMFREGESELPVLVSFHEASAYARWAGKRLPTEEEWEKAARGTGKIAPDGLGITHQYPWGNKYDPEKLNCADFWSSEKIGAHIKLRFNIGARGLVPIIVFDPEGRSPFGAVNMAGNAKEWTSSWYMPYKGNRSKQGKAYNRYGMQFKVVRGGAWYSHRYRARATSREIGGIPNLYTDNQPGFRCAKDASQRDKKSD